MSTLLSEAGKLRLELDRAGERVTLRVVGTINEDSNFLPIVQLVEKGGPLKVLHFDLGQVDSINSCGIREWVQMMERVAPQTQCVFALVNELIVDQANMVPTFFGKSGSARVLAFLGPYLCAKCDVRREVSLQPGQITFEGNRPIAPKHECPTCGTEMAFDSIEAEYFGFIKRLAA